MNSIEEHALLSIENGDEMHINLKILQEAKMKQLIIGMFLVGLFLLGSILSLAVSASSSSGSSISSGGNYIYSSMTGTLSWTPNAIGFYDLPSAPSSTSLTLDIHQRKNINNRANEVLVLLGEEYFKNQVLNQVVSNSFMASTNLLATVINSNILVWDPNFGEIYNPTHVQLTQTTLNCMTGSVCFSARMYGSNGVVIQAQRIIVFPGNTNNLIVMEPESG